MGRSEKETSPLYEGTIAHDLSIVYLFGAAGDPIAPRRAGDIARPSAIRKKQVTGLSSGVRGAGNALRSPGDTVEKS